MNNIKFVNSSWNLISDLKNEYLGRLTNYPDGYWDDLLWEADIYACVNDSGERINPSWRYAICGATSYSATISFVKVSFAKRKYMTVTGLI